MDLPRTIGLMGAPPRPGGRPGVSVIRPVLLVGEYPLPEDAAWLRDQHGITAVLSLQDDADLASKGIELHAAERARGLAGTAGERHPAPRACEKASATQIRSPFTRPSRPARGIGRAGGRRRAGSARGCRRRPDVEPARGRRCGRGAAGPPDGECSAQSGRTPRSGHPQAARRADEQALGRRRTRAGRGCAHSSPLTLSSSFPRSPAGSPARCTLTGGSEAMLLGGTRPTGDLDFELALPPGCARLWRAVEEAVAAAAAETAVTVQYSADIDRWSSITVPTAKRRTRLRRRVGRVAVHLLEPRCWAVYKLARYLDADVEDLRAVLRRQRVPSLGLARLCGESLRASPRSTQLFLFRQD